LVGLSFTPALTRPGRVAIALAAVRRRERGLAPAQALPESL
jgi:hypothetical protein